MKYLSFPYVYNHLAFFKFCGCACALLKSPTAVESYWLSVAKMAPLRRNITFELCAWGFGNVETFGSRMSHLWRTSQDIAGKDSQTWSHNRCSFNSPLMNRSRFLRFNDGIIR
jgi:hypothetical protein